MSTADLFVRRNIWSLEGSDPWDEVTTGYAKAVAEMRGRPTDDPTSWSYQAAMHATYADPPPGADWNQCQHASWFFLPWHRMYTYYFERIVRKAVVSQGGSADWALPYWDYSAVAPANTLPPAFRLPTWRVDDADQPNPLYTSHRAPGINDGASLSPRQTSFAYAFSFTNFTDLPAPSFGGGRAPATHFSRFTGALENQPHNIIHDLVGGPGAGQCQQGWMSDPNCAAQDPIFWLHHTNIDRLWTNWLAQGGGRTDPTDQAWLGTPFTFYDENGAQVKLTGADILDTVTQLQYSYDDHLPPVTAHLRARIAVNTPPPSPPKGPPRLVAASEDGVTLSGKRTSLTMPLPGATENTLVTLAAQGDPGRLRLNIEGIQAPKAPGVVYEVHLNLPPDADPATDDTWFVGQISFFGSGHHEPGEKPDADPAGLNHTFDITGLVHMLRAQGRWDPRQATVTFIPVGLTPPSGTSGSAYDIEPAVAPRVARVSLSST
ncbi:MAG: tyrosinase family protein [Pseudonocardiaceae bacterium]